MSTTTMPIFAEADVAYAERTDTRLFKRARTWWTVLALLILADENSIFTVAQGPGKSLIKVKQYYDLSSPLLLLATAVMCVTVTILVARNMVPVIRMALRQKSLLCFTALAFISLAWSQDVDTTIRKATLLLLTVAFGWFFAVCYSPVDQLRLLLSVGVVVALGSLTMVILVPQYGLDWGGAWKGILGQKNHLGHAILLLFSGLVFRPVRNSREIRIALSQGVLALPLLVMSRSAGSLVLVFVLVAIRICGPRLKALRRDKLPFAVFGVLCTVLMIAFGHDFVLSLLGRDSTLTGRTHEWSVLSYYALQHFWFGYGYAAFWNGAGDSLHAMKMVGGAMRGADSGYLDLVLQLGAIGLFLFVLIGSLALKNFLTLFQRKHVPLAAYWYVGIIVVTMSGSLTDAFFPVPGTIATFIFVASSAGLTQILLLSTRSTSGTQSYLVEQA